MVIPPPPREYTILLTHLHKPSSSLPLSTHQSLISHFLAQTPTPTPLTATVISHAVHLRLKVLEDEEKGLFTRGIRPRITEWVRGLVSGFKGGQALIRFVCAGGILLGLVDLKKKLGTDPGSGGVRAKTEDELIIALTEIMELYGAPKDSAWEKEFQPATEHGERELRLLSPPSPAPSLTDALSSHLMAAIESTFASGSFLASLPSSCGTTPSGQLSLTTPARPMQPSFPYDGPGPWSQSAPLSGALRVVIGSPLTLPLLTESYPPDGWNSLQAVLAHLHQVATNVENDWAQSAFAGIENENDIAPESRQVAANIWTVLRTLLFTTILLSQSILSTITYTRPLSSAVASHRPRQPFTHLPTHSSLALSTLSTLSRLSFVITKFGGVTSTSTAGLAELKRVFYSALDVLSADVEASEIFVKSLNAHGWSTWALCHDPFADVSIRVTASSSAGQRPAGLLTRARQAFNLACVEQLVPLLSLNTIEHSVLPLCLPHLNDASHRETYESSHSVILAIFAAQPGSRTAVAEVQGIGVQQPAFVEKVVPFYVQCLLENSADGKLTTAQLRLAYSALMSSASGNAPAMGQFCLSSLLSALTGLSEADDAPRRHRLRLVLVSTLSALPLIVLQDALNAVSHEIGASRGEERQQLVKEVFKEIMENVGDGEKEYCLRGGEVESSKGKGKAPEVLSARL
ncbi:hypothetical protein BJV74DRAFT_922453 [Russula compacta]|nr:hypothetical protein BJV74DRAFT_922453 [Russula compacta]